MRLVRLAYDATQEFPVREQFGLTAQIRKSAVSVPSNIAEGAARGGDKEFGYFLNVARGSLSELETQLLIAIDLDYLSADHEVLSVLDRVSRLTTGLHKSVRS